MNKAMVHYTAQYMRRNRKRIVSDIVCLFLCLCSAIILSFSAWSYLSSTQKYEWQQNGKQDVVYKDLSLQECQQVGAQNNRLSCGAVEVFGRQKVEDSAYTDYAVIGSLDPRAEELTQVELLEGVWPKKPGEVVLEKSLGAKLGLSLGEKHTFRFALLGSDQTAEVPCKVVGVCNDFANAQSGTDGTEEIDRMFPNVLTLPETVTPLLQGEEPIRHLLVKFKGKMPSADFGGLFAQWTGRSEVSFHSKYVSSSNGTGGAVYRDNNQLSINYIFIILLSVSAFVILISLVLNVAMNQKRNTGDIRRLKLSGASVADVRRFLFLRESFCFLCALPAALAVGFGVLFWFQKSVMAQFWELFSIRFHPGLLAGLLLLVYGLSLLALFVGTVKELGKPPLAAEAREESFHSVSNRTMKVKSPVLLWAVKSFFKNRKSSRASLCLLSLCVMLLAAGTVLSSALIRDLKENYVLDYRLMEDNGAFVTILEVPFHLNSGISQRDWNRVKELDEAAFATATKQLRCKIVTNSKEGYPAQDFFFDDFDYANKEAVQQDKLALGYTKDEYLAPYRITGMEDELIKLLEPYLKEGKVDWEGLNSGKKVLALWNNRDASFHVGQKVRITQSILDPTKTQEEVFQTWRTSTKRYDREFEVCGIVDMTKIKDASLLEISRSLSGFAMPNRAFRVFPFDTNYSDVFVALKDPHVSEKTDAVFAGLKAIYPNANIVSKKAESLSLSLLVGVTQAVLQVVNVVIALFAFISLYNMIQKRIAGQAKAIALLRSIGFSLPKTLFSQYLELVILSMASVLIGFVLSFPVQFLFNRDDLWGGYPWTVLLLCLLVLCAVSFLIVWLALRPVYKKSVVSLLNNG